MGLIRTILLGDEHESLPKPVVGLLGFLIVMAFTAEIALGTGSASLANVELLRSMGRSDAAGARRDLGRALAILPRRYSSAGTAALMGKAFANEGDDATARAVWQDGLSLTPTDDRVRYWFGNADDRLGLWSDALSTWQRDPEVMRLVSENLADLGEAAMGRNEMMESERLLLRATEVDPSNPDPLYTLSELYRRDPFIQQGPQKAIEMARRAAAVDPVESADKYYILGTADYLEGNCTAASEQFWLALQIEPEQTGSLHFLGVCDLELGNIDEGVALLQELVTVIPTHYWSYVHLARVADEQGDPDLAACYRRAAEKVQGAGDIGADDARARGLAPEPCF
jgi:tetratricopeptide (TPR) repeat protein